MAGKAFRRLDPGVGESFAEDEDAYASHAAFLHVGRSGAMAGLALIPLGRAAGDVLVAMGRFTVAVVVVLMACLAHLRADNPITSPDFCREKSSP